MQPGSKLGPYEIRDTLGKGGMGEVYRGYDPRLEREVAIKVLPPEVAADTDRLARFKREAKALAAVRHPGVVTIFSVEESNGVHFLAMELVRGATLSRRIPQQGMELTEFCKVSLQLAEALAAAHELGIVHRDLKPGNVMVDDAGNTTLIDFGLVKCVVGPTSPEAETVPAQHQTQDGAVLGTWHYMSPEQARGIEVDPRSDIFSLGIVFYEMLSGKRPFDAASPVELASSILQAQPAALQTLKPGIPPQLATIVKRCLEKKPDERFGTAAELRDALQEAMASLGIAPQGVALRRRQLGPLSITLGLVVVAAVAFGLWRYTERQGQERWARLEAIPEVIRLVGESRTREAAELALEAEQVVGSDPVLEPLWPRMSSPFKVISDPSGAEVEYRPYDDPNQPWRRLGVTPIERERFPMGAYRFRITNEGFETRVVARSTMSAQQVEELRSVGIEYTDDPSYIVNVELVPAGSSEEMVVVAAGVYSAVPLYGFPPVFPTQLPRYFIDRTEVTNAAFHEFVVAGGYTDPSLWADGFERDGRELSWHEAMAVFQDSTGRPGPATWLLGQSPEGRGDYPVAGVSWFEAAAYCRWKDKALPSVFHWARATLPSSDAWIPFSPLLARASNMEGERLEPVGTSDAIGISGAQDLAGNVREWVSTEAGTRRYLIGAAWSDPFYFVHNAYAASPWQRRETDGFRCARYPEGGMPAHLPRNIEYPEQDYSLPEPMADTTFETIRTFFAYDRDRPLRASEDSTRELEWGATEQWVSIDAAYGDERLLLRITLPQQTTPPFQTIIFFPGGDVLRSNVIGQPPLEFLVRSGRALIEPVYDGTYQRNDGRTLQRWAGEASRRELLAHWANDLGRTIDYLLERPDLDGTQVAYLGLSTGASLVPTLLPFEPRFRAAVLYSGGYGIREPQASLDYRMSLAQRLQVPILMLGGRHDYVLPVEPSQNGLFESFGTPEEHKSLHLYDAGHWPLPMSELIRETVDFLDRYLGPVETR